MVQLLYPVGLIAGPVWFQSPACVTVVSGGIRILGATAVLMQEAKVLQAKTLELDWGWTGYMEVKTEQALGFSSVWVLLSQYSG